MDLNITTLKVKNIPNFILKDKKKVEELFKQFGGVDIRTFCNSTQFNGYAYVNFPNRELASLASVRIQQLSFEPNKYLSVEFAIPDQDKINKIQTLHSNKISASEFNPVLNNSYNDLNKLFNNKEIEQNENDKNPSPIAPELGIDYPSMPTLKYQYPPPNPDIIINIMNAIVAVPKLYVQVIHLMNKMNLPPPFGEATTMTPMNKTEELRKRKKRDALLSSDESELESDDDINNKGNISYKKNENIPINDQITTSAHIDKKSKIMSTSNDIQIKINIDNKLTKNDKNEMNENNNNNPIEPSISSITNSNSNNYEPNKNCISLDILQKNKISQEEMEKLPAYRNYKEGIPSRTLFLKNINVKLTKEKDLEYIFGRYLKDEEMNEKLNIRLMTSGRMKGQAFVKLPSVEMAMLLLKEVHGYILNDKAIIIQYGKATD
ncbi:hypothetical protein PIROE2DRAFT_1813 [Piromyces sp. E2]|nr:hypothetical protein PIROE2DRAFT_1813 [Piromyces sp. E2]|eukprot:OUM70129.1 hypothetical protein PIROE2DRAFT_1813 [Piromyces sp. E2]